MKNINTLIILFLIAGILIPSCKKNKTVEPVIASHSNNTSACTTCPSMFMDTTVNTPYSQKVNFIYRGGMKQSGSIFRKTTLGFFGTGGVAIDFNVANMGFVSQPTKVSFVHHKHGHGRGLDSLVNVKFTNTPLIVTTPDSLQFYLAPYGYSVQYFNYHSTNIYGSGVISSCDGFADSVVISGNIPNNVLIGTSMLESQLRNICFSFN